MNTGLRLIIPDKKYFNEYICFYNEEQVNPSDYKLSSPDNYLLRVEERKNGVNLPPNYVKASELWIMENDSLIAVCNVRHQLSEQLLEYAGSIGLIIRSNKRNMGYGKKCLSLILNYAKNELGLKKVLLTAKEDNFASQKVITACGGILTKNSYSSYARAYLLYYWINLDDHIIETERLILRETTLTDFDNLKSVISDPINMKYYPVPYSDEGVLRWLNWCISCYQKYGFGLWAVIKKDTGEYIGDCGLSMQNIDNEKVPEIGYHLKLNEHRKGYGYEAASAVKDYIFTYYTYDRLYSYMTSLNIASSSLAKKNGMTFIKEYKEDGVPHKVFSISRKEWLAHKANHE